MPTAPERCEALFPIEGTVDLRRCGKPGRQVRKYLMPWGVVLCTECEAAMESKYGSK